MDRLPDDSLVVSVGGQVKFMSGRESSFTLFLTSNTDFATVCQFRNIVSGPSVIPVQRPYSSISSYKFRQASDFWYLTGFEEPDSAVLLEKNSSKRGYRMTLFCSGKDSAKEQWEGARTSFQDAVSHFKADDAQPLSSFPSALKSLAASFSNVYLDVPRQNHSRRGRGLSHKSIIKVPLPLGSRVQVLTLDFFRSTCVLPGLPLDQSWRVLLTPSTVQSGSPLPQRLPNYEL